MDQFDLKILEALQQDGKVSIAELGRMIGLSTTATKERVKKLENDGVIAEYTAVLNSEGLGIDLTAFITVPVGDISIREMGERLIALPEVLECHKVTGNTCFLIKAKVRNAEALEKLIDSINQYAKNTYTYLVLSTLKETMHLDLSHL